MAPIRFASFGTALALCVGFAVSPAWADIIYGSPDTSVDWAQEFCLTNCGTETTSSPITQIVAVMTTPGVTFTSLSSVYTNASETTLDSGATTTLGSTTSVINFNPADSADVFFTLGFSPLTLSTPFTFYWEQWDGSQLITTNSSFTSSDIVSWNGSSWSITPTSDPPMSDSVPEPGTLALFGLGLAALFLVRRRRAS